MPMERIEVVERAAAALQAQHLANFAGVAGIERIERLSAALSFRLQTCPGSDVMLGGAYSRLQLWLWDQPEIGGIIWLRDDLEPETRLFAIAHELGHFALHRGEGISIHAACDQREVDQQADPGELRTEDHVVQEYTPRARRELEASAFAAELLAPRAEVRRIFTAAARVDTAWLARHFGISHALADRRLIDAILAPTRPVGYRGNGGALARGDVGSAESPPLPGDLIARLDDGQRLAARAQGPALVVAGPGTGKTATLVGRVAHLVEERHIPPERVLALTFSNRAAGEMRERLAGSGLPSERMPIMTIHAFAATLLREYASRVPHTPDEAELKPDFHILDEANAYLLMEELLGELPLHYYRSLGNPTAHLRTLLADFSHARDELLTPADYLALVDTMPLAPQRDEAAEIEMADTRTNAKKSQRKKPQPPDGAFTQEQVARARERAEAYAVWVRALRRRGLVDFGSLILRAVELLRANPAALAEVRARYPEVLVDEFQDTNRAAAALLMLVAGKTGGGLWVVGDQNQSIYRFRGASPGNLPRLVEQYPNLRVLTLRRCYRAVPTIVALGSAMAARMAELGATIAVNNEQAGALHEATQPLALASARGDGAYPSIRCAEDFASAAHERAGLAAAIEHHHALGYRYGDQAILCRTHKQVREIAAVLAGLGTPVSQLGVFFERPEVKDALMLLLLAAGPDARGLLRATPLLIGLGYPPPTGSELAAVARAFSSQRRRLPGALHDRVLLSQITALSPSTRAGLVALGEEAAGVRNSSTVGHRLTAFLLHAGGYAWRLARVADGIDEPRPDAPHSNALLPGMASAAHAQQALAALGELVRLAWRFDIRWAGDPEFQARLARAVTHRRAALSAEPDTLTPAPGADVVTATVSSDANAQTQLTEAPHVVRCFLHYLHALRATDVLIPVPAGEEDAVQALTLHQSKGLEFPVVMLPGLAQGQFPLGSHGRDEVCPPGFRETDAPGESEAEERCLFYVGVTRARDVVAFTRARSYSKATGGIPRTAERSALLALVDGAPGWENAETLLSAKECDRLLAVAAAFEEIEEHDGDDDAEMAPIADLAAGTLAAQKPIHRLRDLEQYLNCPRQYKYAHLYRLFDPTEDAVYRFHRYVRQSTRELRDMRTATPGADWNAAQAHLRALWDEVGSTGHAYDTFYWQAAETILREEWQAITATAGTAAANKVTLAEELVAHLKYCDVQVTADREIERVVRTGAAVTSLTVLVRLHTGRPRDDDRKDLTLPLYYLAHQQAHPGAPVQIALAYTGATLEDGEDGSAGVYDPCNQVNITDDARQAAEKYRDPARKRRSRLDKLDEAAMGIAAGQFAPRPEERRCAACAYCYVCPSDPDSVPFGPPSAGDASDASLPGASARSASTS